MNQTDDGFGLLAQSPSKSFYICEAERKVPPWKKTWTIQGGNRLSEAGIDMVDLVLRSMSVDGDEGRTYYLGPNASRVNFASQQRRALNLVWALEAKGKIKSFQSIAVVGAGVGGLMASAALVSRGFSVTLFDQAPDICTAQSETDKRIIHPTINYWPENRILDTTDFPFLNWGFGPCRRVIRHIQYQWERFFAPSIAQKNMSTKVVSRIKDDNTVSLEDDDGATYGPYSAVIFATGFGNERTVDGALNASYWDDFDWPVISDGGMKIAVSGTGDGGLIDALRAALPNFDRGNLALDVARKIDEIPFLVGRLTNIEVAANEIADQVERQLFLRNEYSGLALTQDILDVVLDFPGRADAVDPVVLLYNGASPYDTNSAPIHRVLLKICEGDDLIETVKGRLVPKANGTCAVEDLEPGKSIDPTNHVFIPRHGVGVCQAVMAIDEDAAKTLSDPNVRGFANVVKGKLFPYGYFEAGPGSSVFPKMEQLSEYSDLLEFLARPLLEGFSARYASQVVKKKNEAYIEITFRNHGVSQDPKFPKSFFGLPVKTTAGGSRRILLSGERINEDVLETKVELLQPGSRIYLGEENPKAGRTGAVGFFVTDTNAPHSLYAVTAAHIFDANFNGLVYSSIAGEHTPIGRRVKLSSVPESHELNYETYDLAFIELLPDIRVSASPLDAKLVGYVDTPSEILEEEVFRFITGKDIASGTVTAMGSVLHAESSAKGMLSFSDTIEVTTEDAEFSNVGDSGAPVIDAVGRVLGLVVAGDFAGRKTYITPVNKILDSQEVKLVSDSVNLGDVLSRIDELGSEKAISVLEELNAELVRDRQVVTIKELVDFRATNNDRIERFEESIPRPESEEDKGQRWAIQLLKEIARKDGSLAVSISALIGIAAGVISGVSGAVLSLSVVVLAKSMPEVLREISKRSDSDLAKRLKEFLD